MNNAIENFKQAILRLEDRGTERSYYPLLCNFLKEYASGFSRDIDSTPEENMGATDKKIGFPDITVREGNHLTGWIEVKAPGEDLKNKNFSEQFKKYRDSLENILFTNLKDWSLWQWDDKGQAKEVLKIVFDPTDFAKGAEEKFEGMFHKFLEGRAYAARTPKQLALALAKKARLLSKQVEEAFDEVDEESDLVKLKGAFENTLIQNISVHQFANMIAETMAYSLFLAQLEHIKRGNNSIFNLSTAIDYLPTNIPVLESLYTLVKNIAKKYPSIHTASQALIDQLENADMDRIYKKLVEHKPGEDPVIQFYEPFLSEYDPKEREARGVYYTPKPVVDYIVRSVDCILKEKFDKKKGLADESVNILDPATGTGTFLMSAIQTIYYNIKDENQSLGEDIVKQEFNKVVLNHILKHFYGFELLVAPYAVAHLKLTLLIEELGFDFKLTEDDDDPDNDRFKIYLANTLDDPEKKPQDFFGFGSITEESEKARKVKKDVPIIVIMGNPPYSNFGRMNKGEWILNLLKDYKEGLNERKINIDDDYIKFIRFAQWKLSETSQGIFAMITNNSFIDGITHRVMRKNLMDTFDEIYIYNLHGNLRKNEVCPDGSKDENVFNIMTGVSINIFIKYKDKKQKCEVKYFDLWGQRGFKYSKLFEENFDTTNWKKILPKSKNYFFIKRDDKVDQDYKNYINVSKIFPINSVGIGTKVDSISIDYNVSDLINRVNSILNNKYKKEDLILKYNLSIRTTWEYERALRAKYSDKKIVEYSYRPFDERYIFYDNDFLSRSRSEVMDNLYHKKNIALVIPRQARVQSWQHCFVTDKVSDESFLAGGRNLGAGIVCPLYLYKNEKGQANLLTEKNKLNINIDVKFNNALCEKLGFSIFAKRNEDKIKNIKPENIFYYIYSILYSPIYRERYYEQLKIDYPRLPLTSNKKLFVLLSEQGNKLVNLHLLGKNPFDKSKTIFDEPNKWRVKAEGTKPEVIEDWLVNEVRYDGKEKRVYVNKGQYFEGVEKEVWEFMVGGYQVCEKWLKDRKKAGRSLDVDDLKHYMKIVVALRETIRIMKEIDEVIDKHGGWPIK